VICTLGCTIFDREHYSAAAMGGDEAGRSQRRCATPILPIGFFTHPDPD